MRFIAFDQSSNVTGWSLWEDGHLIEHEMIDLKKEKNSEKRFAEMVLRIYKVIRATNPSLVVIEEVAQQQNVLTVKVLARLQGAIIGYCTAHSIAVKIVEPSHWRSVLEFQQGRGVKREDLKWQALDYVRKTFGLQLPEDMAEAVCIGAAHIEETNKY